MKTIDGHNVWHWCRIMEQLGSAMLTMKQMGFNTDEIDKARQTASRNYHQLLTH